MTPDTNQTVLISALVDLRLGVEMDQHNLADAEVKLAALDAAITALASQKEKSDGRAPY